MALGVLLAMMKVGRQVMGRTPGARLSTRVRGPLPWWLVKGHIWLRVTVPREETTDYVNAPDHARESTGLRIWQGVLRTEGAKDALRVAIALQMRCRISITVPGVPRGGIFDMWLRHERR